MKHMMLQEKYPVFTMEVGKNEIAHRTVDGIVDYFLAKIAEHPIAQFIAVFDHYAHTKALPQGKSPPTLSRLKTWCFASVHTCLTRKCWQYAPELLALLKKPILS